MIMLAHCISPDDSFVVIGRHHWMDNASGEKLNIAEYIPHPEFDYDEGENYDNDVMLLLLERPMPDEAPLVRLNSNTSLPEVNSPVTVMGWGDTDIDWLAFEMSDVLKSAEVHVQSNEECAASEGMIRGDPHFYHEHVTQNMLCAEGKGVDSCQNDSGESDSTNEQSLIACVFSS